VAAVNVPQVQFALSATDVGVVGQLSAAVVLDLAARQALTSELFVAEGFQNAAVAVGGRTVFVVADEKTAAVADRGLLLTDPDIEGSPQRYAVSAVCSTSAIPSHQIAASDDIDSTVKDAVDPLKISAVVGGVPRRHLFVAMRCYFVIPSHQNESSFAPRYHRDIEE